MRTDAIDVIGVLLCIPFPDGDSLQRQTGDNIFWTWDDFVRVRSLLPPHARIPVTIAYWLGTRMGETLALTWSQVRFHQERRLVEITLSAADTKTKEPRRAFMGDDFYETLWAWGETSQHLGTPWVCHYRGKRVKSLRTCWYTACVKAGLGQFLRPDAPQIHLRQYRGPLLHDFRRTAVSRMEAAGVPRKVAMAISGHKTDSVYRRYHIVSQEDLIAAGARLLAYHEREHGYPKNSLSGEHLVNTFPTTDPSDALSD